MSPTFQPPTVADIPRVLPETRGPAYLFGRHQSPLLRGRTVLRTSANLLTANQASLETDTTGWAVHYQATLARSTAQAAVGSASLEMTHTTTGTGFGAVTSTGLSGVPVDPGVRYNALASFRSAAQAGRTATVTIEWYDAVGTPVASVASSAVAVSTSAWTQASVVGLAPATARYAAVIAFVSDAGVNGEVFYVDAVSFAEGTSTTWVAPSGYTTVDVPSQDTLDTAAEVYQGGHVYTVGEGTAARLSAAGY